MSSPMLISTSMHLPLPMQSINQIQHPPYRVHTDVSSSLLYCCLFVLPFGLHYFLILTARATAYLYVPLATIPLKGHLNPMCITITVRCLYDASNKLMN